jgi:DNA-binding MarR family transcriptional regulator
MQYVEDMARIFESLGLPRMASRVWALLWVTGSLHLSAQELAEELDASAGSVSAATRYLLDLGIIDRVRVPGERRAYFRASTTALERLLLRRTAGAGEMIRLADRGLAEFGDVPTTRARLEDMRHFYVWFLREMEDLAGRWQQASVRPPPAQPRE